MFVIKHNNKAMQKPLEIEVAVFGKMKYLCDWQTVEKFEIMVYERCYRVPLIAVSEEEKEPVTEQQIAACKFLKNELVEVQKRIELFLKNLSHEYSLPDLLDKVQFHNIYFSKDGKFGISGSLDLPDSFLEKMGIGPDNEFGIAIYPNLLPVFSGEEFLSYFGY